MIGNVTTLPDKFYMSGESTYMLTLTGDDLFYSMYN